MNFTFEIYKCEFCSFLLFLQGNFQEKLNKLESESENKGGSFNFGRFLNFQFTTELAPQWHCVDPIILKNFSADQPCVVCTREMN